MFAGLVAASAAVTMIGCSDDDDSSSSSSSSSGTSGTSGTVPEGGAETGGETKGTITGTATYNGAKKGPLIVAVFTQRPVMGQPPGMPIALAANESPTWPGTNNFTVKGVAPGTVYVAAFIMVGSEHRMMGAQPGDPVAMPPVEVMVTAGGSATTTVNIGDIPTGGDGGTDGGDAGTDGGDGG